MNSPVLDFGFALVLIVLGYRAWRSLIDRQDEIRPWHYLVGVVSAIMGTGVVLERFSDFRVQLLLLLALVVGEIGLVILLAEISQVPSVTQLRGGGFLRRSIGREVLPVPVDDREERRRKFKIVSKQDD